MVDLNLTTQQFASAISILFVRSVGSTWPFLLSLRSLTWHVTETRRQVGYLPFQIPSNLFISRISRPGLCALPLRDKDVSRPGGACWHSSTPFAN
jgi:hypothetical protein